MMRRRSNSWRRAGLSLLEVLAALAILLLAIVAVSGLMILGGQNADQVHYQEEAVQIAQTKLAEIVAGALPLTSVGDTPLEEDPTWNWSVQCDQDTIANLWMVTVRVNRAGHQGEPLEYIALSQFVLDPTQRGSTQDSVALAASATTTEETTTNSTTQQGSTTNSTSNPGSTSSGGSTQSGGSSGRTRTPSSGGSTSGGSSGGSMPSSGSSGGSMPSGSSGGGSSGSGPSGGGASGGFGPRGGGN